jgi:hypothetical protein
MLSVHDSVKFLRIVYTPYCQASSHGMQVEEKLTLQRTVRRSTSCAVFREMHAKYAVLRSMEATDASLQVISPSVRNSYLISEVINTCVLI